jgi:simple sugar transport system substrate-binding protein
VSARGFRVVAAIAAVTLAAGACSGGGKVRTTDDAGGGGGGNAPGSSGYTIAMITHETPGDTFWDKIKAGAQQAAKDEGVTLRYSNGRAVRPPGGRRTRSTRPTSRRPTSRS